MTRVAVTGAGGFVGRHVCRRLADAGHEVVGCVRRPAERGAGITAAQISDLADRPGLSRAFAGAQAVVHLAARVHVMRDAAGDPLAEFRRVNVEGTRAIVETAVAAGVARVVFASSVKVMGESNTAPWTERTPPRPADPYGVSKLEAEGVVASLAREAGIGAAILRLPLVYGPGVKANMRRLFELVDRGRPVPLGGIDNRRSLLFVGNLAAAIETVVGAPGLGQETFFLSDGRDLSTPDLVRAIARALGRTPRLIAIPAAGVRIAARLGDALSRVWRVPFTTAAADRLLGSLAVDSSAFAARFGFVPPYSVDDGLAATAAWYRAGGRER